MKDIILAIISIVILVSGCFFVNNTKSQHGVCCGKGCAGCKVYEDYHNKKKK